MSTGTAPAPATPEKFSPIERITNVFFAPSKTFTDLNRDTSWWTAWLLLSVFGFLLVFAMQKQVGFEQITRNEIAASPKATERMDRLSPEVREQQIAMQAKISTYISYATPLFVLVYGVVVAGVLLATFNFGLGTQIKFGTALAVVFFAWIPGTLKSLLAVIALFAGADPEGFNARNPVATNIGFFIHRTDHPVLHSFLSWVDVFAIWYVILLGIGFACVSRVKRNTAISVIAGWYIAIALIGTGLTALFS